MSKLSYICNTNQILNIRPLNDDYAIIQRNGEQFNQAYRKLNNGGGDFYIQARLPRELYLKADPLK